METRASSIELLVEKTLEHITTLEDNLSVVKSNYATREDIEGLKEDIAKFEATLLKWFVGTAVTIASFSFAAAKFIN